MILNQYLLTSVAANNIRTKGLSQRCGPNTAVILPLSLKLLIRRVARLFFMILFSVFFVSVPVSVSVSVCAVVVSGFCRQFSSVFSRQIDMPHADVSQTQLADMVNMISALEKN